MDNDRTVRHQPCCAGARAGESGCFRPGLCVGDRYRQTHCYKIQKCSQDPHISSKSTFLELAVSVGLLGWQVAWCCVQSVLERPTRSSNDCTWGISASQ